MTQPKERRSGSKKCGGSAPAGGGSPLGTASFQGWLETSLEGSNMVRVMRAWILVLLAMAVLVGTGERAVANTELVPGSRLIFPYIDISGGRETFLMLTNASDQSSAPVHIQFYAQNCLRSDQSVFLTPDDIAAVQVSKTLPLALLPPIPGSSAQQNIPGIGWADVDVRNFLCGGVRCPARLRQCRV